MLIERMPHAGHADEIKDGGEISFLSQGTYSIAGPEKTWP